MQWQVTGVCHTPDIFVKWGSIYVVLISPLFSKMAAKQQFWDSVNILFLFQILISYID